MSGIVRVLLVDDHAVVREGYQRLLERAPDIAVVGEASSAAGAYQAFCRLAPNVVVMDISLPDTSGIEAIRRCSLAERNDRRRLGRRARCRPGEEQRPATKRADQRIATPQGSSPTGISAIFVLVPVSITATALERPHAT